MYILIACLLIVSMAMFFWHRNQSVIQETITTISPTPPMITEEIPIPSVVTPTVPAPEETVAVPVPKSVLQDVPFTSQAPFAEWSIATFQNACEEASMVMVAHWLSGAPLSPEIAKKDILTLTRFEEKTYGQSVDTSAKDTEAIFREYYKRDSSRVETDIVLADIIDAVTSGAVVIVPMDGRKLHNPNFRQPGPMTHMVLIIGYDEAKNEFITNDAGTRKGAGYRYPKSILYDAIRDYPTGDHLKIQGVHKDMIVIRKP